MEHDEYITRVEQYLIEHGYDHLTNVKEAAEDLWKICGNDYSVTPEEAAYEFTIGFDGGLES